MTRPSDSSCPVRLHRVTKRFGANGNGRPILDEVSFGTETGCMHLFLGPSGSGKTTLLTLMAGLQRPNSGHVTLFGRPLAAYGAASLQRLRAESIGFVFQDFQLLDTLDVYQNIALVLRFAGRSRREARRTVMDLLDRFGIGHLRRRRPATLSQGEKQRVAVARAVANGADLIIADEPTASLETGQGLQVIHLLRDYAHRQKRCVVVASHDLRLVECADTVQYLNDGVLQPWNGGQRGPHGAPTHPPRREIRRAPDPAHRLEKEMEP